MTSDVLSFPSTSPGVYNELSADGIAARAHWISLVEALQALGPEELERRRARAERRISENGVSYNVYGDPLGANRPWKLDLIPFPIPETEWRTIEAGIIQRAEILELLLSDLYGAQKLLLDGRLPASLVFANPEFLRPVTRLENPPPSYLHVLAVDLARSPDGQWWVLADRTQAPSGAGYTLENRIVISDVLPDLFRGSNVRRLASFFRAERNALTTLAGVDQPRIVLLTPGPLNETYFEHSYLARYLGFSLVEGGDLTVRDRRVFLKTVEGLQRVDVILRRVDDSFCDPLELRGDSFLGVPGLVDAAAAGNVRVANALGSGLIETSAIMPFLPGLSRHLLGEPLKLPSVATWWCGQDYALDWVLEHLDRVVIKPAFPSRGMEPVFGVQLAQAEKSQLTEKMRLKPWEYVAQEQVALSTAPVWENNQFIPRGVVLRTYALNTGAGWIAMPGGLVRAASTDTSVVSMQKGGFSKDAWILSEAPIDTFTLLRPKDQPVELRRGPADLPSRVADDLFWLGRYAERAENIARLLRTSLNRVRQVDEAELECLVRLHNCFDSRNSKLPKKRSPTALELEQELISLMSDTKRSDSLTSTLGRVFRVGSIVRERLSSDMTRLIGQLTQSVEVEEYMLFVEYSAVLSGCLELLSAFSGLERENITRGSGWLFMSLGRRLERAIYAARELREVVNITTESDWPFLEYLLEAADSSMTYRTRYYSNLQPVAVLDVLMTDETNPRSLEFQLSHLADLYGKLPRHVPDDLMGMRRAVALLRSFELHKFDNSPPEVLNLRRSATDEWSRLSRALRELENFLPSWSNNLSNNYFSHARTLRITIGE